MSNKILFIDDDPNIVRTLERELRDVFDFETAQSGEVGLEILVQRSPFAVIVSDCVMPGMNGIEVLTKARQLSPDCVRMMLTGHANLTMAIEAVNKGNIFRLLTKPWDHEILVHALNAAIEQYRLITVQKELLSKTIKLTESLGTERQNLELTNQKLREAIENAHYLAKKANASNVAKTEFLANMSHELRTPLSGVIGMLDLSLDSQLDEQQREYLSLAKYSANALLSIVNDILDFARIEAGKLVMVNSAFSLHAIVLSTVNMLRPKADSKKLTLTYDLAQDVPDQLIGDQERLRQILVTLLGNAVKFTEYGHIEIRIKRAETGLRNKLHFSVTDTGIGIPADKLHTIFESFTQADNSANRKYGGIGLGLSIAKSLVERMGGEIGVESRTGQGSTFHFTAFFEEQTDSALTGKPGPKAASRPRAAASGGETPDRNGPRPAILIADDDEINRTMAAHILINKGYLVETAANGQEAVEKVQNAHFDIVLMDIQMPGLDGLSASRNIRAAGHALPIIALTAGSSEADNDRYRAAGINAYTDKPIHWEVLLDLINRFIQPPLIGANSTSPPPDGETVYDQPAADLATGIYRLSAARFFAQISLELKKLKQAVQLEDGDAIERRAHQLKRTAAYAGMGRVSDEAFRLELSARRHAKETYPAQLQRLENELEACCKELNL